MRAQQEVDGGGLKSGGQGSGTDGGAEKAGEKQSRAGAQGRRREGRGSRDLSLPKEILIKFLICLQIFMKCHDDK
jgi:hypothetical protein